MRHLVVPACLCLMMWSSSTGTVDIRPSDEHIAIAPIVDQTQVTTDTNGSGIAPAVRGSIMPAASGNVNSTAAVPAHIDTTDIAMLSPHSNGWADFEPLQLVSPPPPPPLAAKPVIPRTQEEICDTLAKAANDNNLPAHFFIRLLYQESRFKSEVVSHAGALGIAQFMPETASDVALDNPFDPVQAISASARHLRTLVAQFGNLGLAAAAYNAGPGRIQEWLIKRTKLPKETEGYVKVVTGRPADNWKLLNAGVPDMQLPIHAPCWETANVYAWTAPPIIPLPQFSPRREAERRIAAAMKRKREAERRMAALTVMKKIIRNLSIRKHRKNSVQLAARRHEARQRAARKK